MHAVLIWWAWVYWSLFVTFWGWCWGVNSGLCGFEAHTLSFGRISSPLLWVLCVLTVWWFWRLFIVPRFPLLFCPLSLSVGRACIWKNWVLATKECWQNPCFLSAMVPSLSVEDYLLLSVYHLLLKFRPFSKKGMKVRWPLLKAALSQERRFVQSWAGNLIWEGFMATRVSQVGRMWESLVHS